MSHTPAQEKIAILDCGAQYTKVIDRRVRELSVDTEIFPLEVTADKLREGFSGIIISGGPHSVYEDTAPRYDSSLFDLGLPMLGVCYGMQLINSHFGGKVQSTRKKEYGETEIQVNCETDLFCGLSTTQRVLMSHGDSVVEVAPGFEPIGNSNGTLAAMMDKVRKIYGVQFHPEVDLTENGRQMLQNFLYQVCGLEGNYRLEDRMDIAINELRRTVGNKNVFVLVSGGVDSSVTAALLLKALGPEKVYAVHIDSGFMRQNESDLVCDALSALGLKHMRRIDAEERFLNGTTEIDGKVVGPLKSLTDPEQKRQIIGDVFYHLINEAISDAGINMEETFIAQGTLRPDLIESGNRDISQTAHKIKTHHNDVPLIRAQREKGLIIEPNRDWHKDEVRQVGRLLGLPEELVARQPFPGPGLAVRILCTEQPYVTPDHAAISQALKERAGEEGFGSLVLPVKSVGVQGDGRSYSHLGLLCGDLKPESISWDPLRKLATEIPNYIHQINRVALVLNRTELPEQVTTITPTHLVRPTIDLLRELDDIVTQAFTQAGLLGSISQLLTVLVPVDTENKGRRSVAIRAVVTSDYMTARAAALGKDIPVPLMLDLAQKLSAHPDVDLVMYDITSKPPATVEWE